MQHVSALCPGQRVLRERERAIALAERDRRLSCRRPPWRVPEVLDRLLGALTDRRCELERLAPTALRQPDLREGVFAQDILQIVGLLQRSALDQHRFGLLQVVAFDQTQGVVGRGRAAELMPPVALRVTRPLEVRDRLADASPPQLWQRAGEAGGRERERRASPARVLDGGIGDLERALQRAAEEE